MVEKASFPPSFKNLQKIVMAEVEVAEATKWPATNADEEEDPANKLYLLRQRR